jgi:hypothetical protein
LVVSNVIEDESPESSDAMFSTERLEMALKALKELL